MRVIVVVLLLGILGDCQAQNKEETFRYLRPGPKGFVADTTITFRDMKDGWSLESATGGDKGMKVTARYDNKDRLLSAEAALLKEGVRATVEVDKAVAQVLTKELGVQKFPVEPRVIVTSAPDWGDIFLLCALYDVKAGGQQKFVGLWIHPTQKSMLLPFTVTAEGSDIIDRDGKKVPLGKYRIQIRGPNPYLAWADAEQNLVKLMPLPVKDGRPTGLIREGWEKSWEVLAPAGK